MTSSSMTGVVVSPTTSHFRTPSSDMGMWRLPSKTLIANAHVVTVHMRVRRLQRNAKGQWMHSLAQVVHQV